MSCEADCKHDASIIFTIQYKEWQKFDSNSQIQVLKQETVCIKHLIHRAQRRKIQVVGYKNKKRQGPPTEEILWDTLYNVFC